MTGGVFVRVYEQGAWDREYDERPREVGYTQLPHAPHRGDVLTLGAIGSLTHWQVAGVQWEPPDDSGLPGHTVAVVAFQRPGGIFGVPPTQR